MSTQHNATARASPRERASDAARALAELETRLADTIEGFDKVVEKAEPSFRPVAAEFRALHIRQRANVAMLLETLGHDQDAAGSIFGTVNKAVVSVRSWFDAIDEGIMEAMVNGEKHLLEAYADAINAGFDAEHRGILMADRQALLDLLDRPAGRRG